MNGFSSQVREPVAENRSLSAEIYTQTCWMFTTGFMQGLWEGLDMYVVGRVHGRTR